MGSEMCIRDSIKIGGTIALAAGFGVIMLMTQFVTLGLLSLTTAGGAIGGYLARSRREQLGSPEYKMIEGVEVVDEQPQRLTDATDRDETDREANTVATGEKTVAHEPQSTDVTADNNKPVNKS